MKTWLIYIVKLTWENPILVLGKRMYGYKVHCNLWSIQKCYIYPLIARSTPKKANIAKPQAGSDLPSLEEMGQQELVELVKQLLAERANRQTPLQILTRMSL